ncbi:hypothetical protein EXIGLDRAFT_616211, partial [Exidia glandulosa HHB12029]
MIIDDDSIGALVIDADPPGSSFPTSFPCPGYRLPLVPGFSHHATYPFALHAAQPLPWTYFMSIGHQLTLRADTCSNCSPRYAEEPVACDSCSALQRNKLLQGIRFRMEHGTEPHTPYEYLSHDHMSELVDRKVEQLDKLRQKNLTFGRSLARLATARDRGQRIIKLIAEGNVTR